MILIDQFLAEHPFFCALLEYERRILTHYIELYRCAKNSYLVLPNELQEVLWIVVRGRLAEYAEGPDQEPPSKQLLRYFFPGDLINVNSLTQELISTNGITSIQDDTQVICMTAFHLAKLAQQQPKIHRALHPVYNADGYLISGLPMPIWQQMNDISPPHTRDFGKPWLQRKLLLHSHNSWFSSIIAFFALSAANIWQIKELRWEDLPIFNMALLTISLLALIFIVLQRYRYEYKLKRSLLHITERGLFGFSSKIKSYPLLSISQVKLLSIPILTRLFQFGGLRVHIYHNETVQIFPIDRVQKWLKMFESSLKEARQLQEQMQHSATVKQFQKWHKLQPELIKEINYRNAEIEGKLQRSLRALLLQTSPQATLVLISLYYSLQSELLKIYLTVPLYSLTLIIAFQLLRWLRYTWRISEEFLFCYDNLLGRRHNYKIPIRDIQDIHLEYLNILGFGTISLRINDQSIRLQNLKNPQHILDEIESLRHYTQNPIFGPQPDDFLTHRQLEMYHYFSQISK